MRKLLMAVVMGTLLILAACGGEKSASGDDGNNGDDKLQIVTSFTIIKDLAEEIGGDLVEVHNLVPTGTDPHNYEPLPEDIKHATDADVLFYNGMNLEGGKEGWFFKMINSVGQDKDNVFSVTDGIDPMYIGGGDKKKEVNPHAFIDPSAGVQMAENIRDAIIEVDPDREEQYKEEAAAYIDKLKTIEKDYEKKLSEIPEDDRIIVTSERAFQYLADSYDLKEGFVFEIDTEENGTPEQIKNLVSFVEDNDAPALFVESNVDPRPMETVSQESGIPIYDKPIYSDEIEEEGGEVDTYVKYLNYNLDILYDGLTR
ncbi:metal ABC transporter substrate-binding protein [Lentibacillus halophilus]|uniref:Metal ABC transporter substrate-binding protein n=1 Tax=Lentibacillus halophilus TaxID=295065 RepID=A0ABN0ZHD2_9BACI